LWTFFPRLASNHDPPDLCLARGGIIGMSHLTQLAFIISITVFLISSISSWFLS
jgi:hypothetical protein